MGFSSTSFDPALIATNSDAASSAMVEANAASAAAATAAAKASDASSAVAARSAIWDKASAASSVAATKDNYASWSFAVDGVTKDAITSGDVLDFVGGDNITITRSADDKITIGGDGVLKQNLITNSSFGVWSNGTVADYSDTNTGFSKLHPTACCTDPDNDQNNTTGWSAASATLTSEAGGVTGNRLKLAATSAPGLAVTAGFTMTEGKLYHFKIKCGADVGDQYYIYINSNTYGIPIDITGVVNGAGAGTWDTYDEVIECPSTQTDWKIYMYASNNTDNAYFDNVSLSEMTPACVAADGKAFEGATKTATLDIYRWQNDSTHCKGFYGFKAVKSVDTNEDIYFFGGTIYNKESWYTKFKGRTVTFGCWVYSVGAADNIKIGIVDGISGVGQSSFASADSLQWLEMTMSLSASATQLLPFIRFYGDTGDIAYISQPMLVFGNSIGEGNYIQPPGEIIYCEALLNLTDYSGSTVSANTTINLEEQSSGKIPKGVLAVMTRLLGTCATAGKYIQLTDKTNQQYRMYTQVGGLVNSSSGWARCSGDGDIGIVRDDTFSTVWINVVGVQIR